MNENLKGICGGLVLATGLIGSAIYFMGSYEKPAVLNKEEFFYHGHRGYLEYYKKEGREPNSKIIRFENGDEILEGKLTSDNGRVIRAYPIKD